MDPHEVLVFTVTKISQQMQSLIEQEAALIGVSTRLLLDHAVKSLMDPTTSTFRDGRAVDWRARIRIYDEAKMDQPEGDTDPDLLADAPGALILHGLPSVLGVVMEVVARHHGTPALGIDRVSLQRKIASLRTQISNARRDSGKFTVDYQVVEHKFGRAMDRNMTLRCDVVRVQHDAASEPRRMPLVPALPK